MRAVQEQIQTAVQPLRDALLNGSAHLQLFLMLCDSQPPGAMLSVSDMNVANDRVTGETAAALWRYTLQPVSVRMIYVLPTYPARPAPDGSASVGDWLDHSACAGARWGHATSSTATDTKLELGELCQRQALMLLHVRAVLFLCEQPDATLPMPERRRTNNARQR